MRGDEQGPDAGRAPWRRAVRWLAEAVAVAAIAVALADVSIAPRRIGTLAGVPGLAAPLFHSRSTRAHPAAAPGVEGAPTDPRIARREAARAVLAERCMPCHRRSAAGANPRALAIFDLDDEDWARHMSVTRMHNALGRLRGAPEAQRAAITAYVADVSAASSPIIPAR